MIRIGVRDLKNGLSAALRQVENGDTVEVTDHGRPIARIVSIRPTRVQQLVSEGRMTLPEEDDDLLALGHPPPLQAGERTGSEILAELRQDER